MKKILTWLLVLTMALSLCVPALAASAETEPEGSGTADDPYRIGTAAELAAFRDKVNAGQTELCARLTGDIVLDKTAEWVPVGKENACAYNGVFQGGGHTVSGLTVSTERESAGLFGYLSSRAEITGLTISDSTFAGRRYAGAVAGYSDGAISNCHTAVSVRVKSGDAAGGIVGAMGRKADSITRCSNRAAVTVSALSGGKAGGIVGSCGTVRLTDCFNAGAVSAAGSGTLLVGGLIGDCGGTLAVRIVGAYDVGRISMTGVGSAGGLVGECSGELHVTDAYQLGNVRGASIVGMARDSVKLVNVYKTGVQSDKSAGNGVLTGSAVRMSESALKKAAETLGDHFAVDSAMINSGYPVLAWQNGASAGSSAEEQTADDNGGEDEAAVAGSPAQTLAVTEYLKQDEQTLLLLVRYTGTLEAGMIPAYSGSAMRWSDRYQAYVWLTTDSAAEITDEKVTQVTAAAEQIVYDGDINTSGKVDINDVQLIYNIYNAQIGLASLTTEQLLKADVNGDGAVDTGDALCLVQQLDA